VCVCVVQAVIASVLVFVCVNARTKCECANVYVYVVWSTSERVYVLSAALRYCMKASFVCSVSVLP
jgi:hypothetical protein